MSTTDPSSQVQDQVQDQAEDRHAAAAIIVSRLHEHLGALGELVNLNLSEHVDFYQRAHTELQQALTDIDNA